MREPNYSILAKLRPPTSKNNHKKSLVGQVFTRLTVIALIGHTLTREAMSFWLCRCICGNWNIVAKQKLTQGSTRSCGCHREDNRGNAQRTHGRSRSRTYNIWTGMINRCYNVKDEDYPYWGGRGIIVCERWRHSFDNFLTDMNEPPTNRHQIDRIDVNGNYEPSNCRWATRLEQARNTRRNRYLTAHGKTYCVSQWAEITGVNQLLIARRLKRGWSTEEALEFKERSKPLKIKEIEVNSRVR